MFISVMCVCDILPPLPGVECFILLIGTSTTCYLSHEIKLSKPSVCFILNIWKAFDFIHSIHIYIYLLPHMKRNEIRFSKRIHRRILKSCALKKGHLLLPPISIPFQIHFAYACKVFFGSTPLLIFCWTIKIYTK